MGDRRRIAGVGLADVFRAKDGSLWKVVGIAEAPTVTIELVDPPWQIHPDVRDRRHLVIGSATFNEFEQLVPTGDEEPEIPERWKTLRFLPERHGELTIETEEDARGLSRMVGGISVRPGDKLTWGLGIEGETS